VQQASVNIRSKPISYEQLVRCAWVVSTLTFELIFDEEMIDTVPKVGTCAHYGSD